MALFFAITSAPHKLGKANKPVFSSDAAVWILNPIAWNKRSIDLKQYDGSLLTPTDAASGAYKPAADAGTIKPFPIAIYGSHNSQRIVAQRGVFVCFGKETKPMEKLLADGIFPKDCLIKLVLPRGRLPEIYQALQRSGITDSVAFPDLDGLAREIKREFHFDL